MKRIVTRALIVLVATLAIVSAQVAPASATTSKKLISDLAAMWTTLLETPSAQNPFGTGGAAFACIDIGGRTVAPFAGGAEFSCTVKPGTKIFVAGFSWECSSFPGDHPNSGTTEPELRQCARDNDLQVAPTVNVDGKSVKVTPVETPELKIVMPEDPIFAVPAGTEGRSVAHGWVALLNPLAPGTHTIEIGGSSPANTTTIVVTPGP